jgi:acyl transferase domain-containing protein/NAD(P)-dependent dehydrogenase (short-subunit alcohol dehydrogenase family)/SAM-dependent methyltransferase/acyl carrier protein
MSELSSRIANLSPEKRAILARRLQQGKASPPPVSEPIAVIGVGCRLPGGVDGPEAFWRMLSGRVDAITEVPPDRWPADEFYDADPSAAGKMATRWGGFLSQVDRFDADFFGIVPREAERMDPQQRLLLETSWEALELAGRPAESLAGTRVGVFVGMHSMSSDYYWSQARDLRGVDVHTSTGAAHSIAANRISYLLDLRGPSLAVDTACSSSLVAVHLACQSLRTGECDAALAGGVNLMLSPEASVAFSKLRMMASDGRCKSFDSRADGFVRGEGCGIVVLRRLDHALRDGDRILAVIRGSAVNQDGATNGLTAPNGLSQQEVVRQALRDANVEPARISFVETHGTGTALGDPIEVESLAQVLAGTGSPAPACLLGAVKTNIGHLEAAAGIAGLIKVVLCLQHRHIPANLHFRALNPHISLEGSRLALPGDGGEWLPGSSEPRCAGVSSFGFGGTNAHVVLEEFVSPVAAAGASMRPDDATPRILPLSARTPDAVVEHVGNVARWLGEPSSAAYSTRDIASTAGVRRTHHEYRRAVVGASREEWQAALRNGHGEAVARGRAERTLRPWPGVVFVYSGQGPQWAGMGRDLYDANAVFRAALDRCDAEFRRHTSWSVLEELARPEASSRLQDTAIAQPAIFAIQYALTERFKEWGITPDAVVGHSAGEVAAAWASGVLHFEDAARLVVHRGRLMERAAGRGAMVAVELSSENARAAIAGFGDRVDLAAFNSPTSTVLSGDPMAMDAIVETLKREGVFVKRLAVNYAFHSKQMEVLQPDLLRELSGLQPCAATVPIASTVTGRLSEGPEHDALYWARNMREPVRFAEAIQALTAIGHRAFLELSPHPILGSMIARCAGEPLVTCGSLRKGADALREMLLNVGRLYEAGLGIDFRRFNDGPAEVVPLPAYPWQKARHWFVAAQEPARQQAHGPSHPLVGRRLQSALPIFEQDLALETLPMLGDHRVFGRAVAPAAALLEMVRIAGAHAIGSPGVAVRDLVIEQPLVIPEDRPRRVQTAVVRVDKRDPEIHVFTASGSGTAEWVRHAVAGVTAVSSPSARAGIDLGAVLARCQAVTTDELYERLEQRGLRIGPSFHSIESMWQGEREAIARIPAPKGDADLLNTVWMDACLQPLVAAAGDTTCLLVGVQRLATYGEPGAVWCHAVLTRDAAERRTLTGTVRAYGDDGTLRLEADGIAMRVLDDVRADVRGDEAIQPARYEIAWRQRSLPSPDSDGIVPTPEFVSRLRGQHQFDAYERLVPELDALSAAYVVRALQDLGWAPAAGDLVSIDALAATLGIVPAHRRLFGRLCEMLQETGFLEPEGDLLRVARVLQVERDVREWCADLRRTYGMCDAELSLVERCGLELGPVLNGRRDALQLLFPQGSFEAVERLYRDSPFSRVDNTLLQHAVSAAIAGRPAAEPVRILEIGAGTGGTTTYVLPAVSGRKLEYVFTDVSQIFLIRARQKFGTTPGLRFELLDIERSPGDQGFAGRQFDVVIAANVLHATTDLRRTLGHVRQLLAPQGRVFLLEVTRPQRWIDLTFGLTEGWWRFADRDIRPTRALLSPPEWRALLTREGFQRPMAIPDPVGDSSQESIIVAEAGGGGASSTPSRQWLIVRDRGGVGSELVSRLRTNGEDAVLVTDLPDRLETLSGVASGARWRGIVYLRALDEEVEDDRPIEGVVARQAWLADEVVRCSSLVAGMPEGRLWVVTRRAQAVATPGETPGTDIAGSALWGLGRGIAVEQPDGWGGVIDVDGDALAIAGRVQAEIESPDGEDQIAWRAETRYVPRLVRSANVDGQGPSRQSDRSYLITGGTGGVGQLVARALIERGVRHLVLTSRTPLESGDAADPQVQRRRQAVEELRAMGATVTVAAVDVADQAGMTLLFQQFGTTRPAIAGVFHAAAAIGTRALRELDTASIAAMYRAKLGGAMVLDRLTRGLDLDEFVLFSSTTALLGASGLAHYAAANAFLDALAYARRERNLPALSVNWGTWEAMRTFSEAEQAAVARGGLVPMTSERAMAILDRALIGRVPQEMIAAVDWTVLKPAYEVRRARPFLSEIDAHELPASRVPSGPAAEHAPGLRARLAAVAPSARHDFVVDAVRGVVASVMGYPPDRPIDARQGFFDLGMDSLMTVDLRARLSALAGCDLPAGVTFSHPSIEALADYLARAVIRLDDETVAAVPAAAEQIHVEAPRSIEDTLSLIDAELAAIDDLVRD